MALPTLARLWALLAGWIASSLLVACGGPEPGTRPNIVILIADDHTSRALGAVGQPWLETPNLDRIAEEGVRFENLFVTTSLCSPARASFLTGLYARRHGIVDDQTPLSEDAVTFAPERQRSVT